MFALEFRLQPVSSSQPPDGGTPTKTSAFPHGPTMNLRSALAAIALVWSVPVFAADLRVYPSEVNLAGPGRTQQLLVVEEENGRTVRDLTGSAKYQLPEG